MLRIDVAIAEIGSTTTTVSAFDGLDEPEPRFLGQGLSPTTVAQGDVLVGLENAVADLCRNVGTSSLEWCRMLACSSAAGGLRMTVHGLVYDMTVKAAREAALGAGAIVHMITAGELTDSDLDRIRDIRPNIILLAGGVDYGERDIITGNAQRLASLDLGVPVIYAGNVACAGEVAEALGPDTQVVENVYPRIDQLNVEPTRRAIQNVFERHIVRAPGMERVGEMVHGGIMPTPGAVMEAAKAMAAVAGDLMAIDVGGATTDVHSVTEGSEEVARMLVAPEPRAKRTVEGDLGVFVNAGNMVRTLGYERVEEALGFSPGTILDRLQYVPSDDQERALVLFLAREAVGMAVERHAGRTRYLYGPTGRIMVAEGKDLSRVKWIIGTGGVLTRMTEGRDILSEFLARRPPMGLYPERASVVIDHNYVMAACGVLARHHPRAAVSLLCASLDSGTPDGGNPCGY